jgi:hypothetical protein
MPQSVQRFATDWTTGELQFDSRQMKKGFSHLHRFQTISVAHSSSDLMGKRTISPMLREHGREANH